MKRITIMFGLISATIIILYTFATFIFFGDFSHISVTDFMILETLGYLRYIILLLTIYFAIRTFKKQNNGQLTYRQAAKQGIMVALVIAVCIGLMESIYIIMEPGFYEKYGKLYAGQLKAKGASAEKINEMKAEMDKYKWMQNAPMTGLFYFFETALIGTIGSLIMARFFKTKKSS